jgi:hypothetical protein
MVRRLIVVVLALLLAVQVVRNAAVGALAPLQPAAAAKIWASHPTVEISLGLAEIGRASRERSSISPATFAIIDDAAAKSPLSAEPFLVRGVQAQVAGDAREASRAFVAAQWRDPRSMPAAYFLANYYFRVGRPLEGLEQTAVLARLSPSGGEAVAAYVAAYAQNPANWPEMRALFRSQTNLEDSVLVALAGDPRNADAILAIADAAHRKPGSSWLPALLASLVKSGDYARAHRIWSSVGGGRAGGYLVYDSDFSSPTPPPPFNWSLASSTVGLAERQPGRRLHAIFYGSEDGVLASQLLLLAPGTYRLQMQLVGTPNHPEALSWSVRCDKSAEPIASSAIDQAAARGWSFAVPANCPAQWLELSGRSGDVTQQSDVTIGPLMLVRAGPNG